MSDEKPGATGRYPDGQLGPEDEGELAIQLVVDRTRGLVVIEFGKPVKWVGLPADKARELGLLLVRDAGKLDGAFTTIQFHTQPAKGKPQ